MLSARGSVSERRQLPSHRRCGNRIRALHPDGFEFRTARGYIPRDGLRRTEVRTAVGIAHGCVRRTAKPSVLGVAARGMPVHRFDLGHDDIDRLVGLVGPNFLNQLDDDIRSAERRILVEPTAQHTV